MASVEADSRTYPLAANVVAEALGTAMLLTAVVGSGIMAERLTNDDALRLLCNTLATGATLFVAIMLFAPISGAHFNPAVTLVSGLQRWTALSYLVAQVLGAILGVWLAHAMFDEPVFAVGIKARTGAGQWLSEAVATFGLVLTIAGTAHSQPRDDRGLGRALHRRRLLVHRVHVVRQSRRDARQKPHADLLRNCAARRARLHRGAAARRRRGMDVRARSLRRQRLKRIGAR